MDNREKFEAWWARNSDDNNNTKVAAMEAWETCAEQKDKEIAELKELLTKALDERDHFYNIELARQASMCAKVIK